MAKKQYRSLKTKAKVEKARTTKPQLMPQPATPPKPSLFAALRSAIAPHLTGTAIADLRKSKLPALAKKAGVKVDDLRTFISAHKLSADMHIPAYVLFALGKRGTKLDRAKLLATSHRDREKSLKSAVKHNFVPSQAMSSSAAAKSTFARLQANTTPLKILRKTYGLEISDGMIRKLEAKRLITFADLRRAGGLDVVAKKVGLRHDNPGLKALLAHANLSVLGSEVRTNKELIKQGYSSLAQITNTPEGILIDQLRSSIGISETFRIRSVAKAKGEIIKNTYGEALANQANGFQFPPDFMRVQYQRCECKDCESAVSPLAYLADLMGYATSKIGRAKQNIVPLYRLVHPTVGDHFYTPNAKERDTAVAVAGYRYEGIAGYVYSRQISGTLPFYRLYHPTLFDHFYTISSQERTNATSKLGYVDEGSVGFVHDFSHGATTIPLYRLLNDKTKDHFYTTDPVERQQAIDRYGYHQEGIEKACHLPKEGFSLIAPHELESMFHQPFLDLPLSCKQADELVRQVRIAVEVLRHYIEAQQITFAQTFLEQEAQYLQDSYQKLLLKLGTTYMALRAVRGGTQEERVALATGLGIPVGDGNQRDYLGELLLALPSITEREVERIFGLADTTRDPLSRGAKFSDGPDQLRGKGQIRRWNLDGISWNVNTDQDGLLYVHLSQAAGKTKLQVYRAANSINTVDLEAVAEVDKTEKTLSLADYNLNGFTNRLTGEVEVKYTHDTTSITIQAVPQLLSWRLQYLRSVWEWQDWIRDPYSTLTQSEERLPIIDPDLIGPDDFRDPSGAAGTPFKKFWIPRRKWVDALIRTLHDTVFPGQVTAPVSGAFDALFQQMRQTSDGNTIKSFWPATAPTRLDTLSLRLQDKTDKAQHTQAITDLSDEFSLVPDMLNRLLALREKYDGSVYDSTKNAPLDEGEWAELINILVQSHKQTWYDTWIQEEDSEPVNLGPHDFWIPLRDYKEGGWPPVVLPNGVPYVDPETVKLEELPDETAGTQAIQLWDHRRTELQTFRNNISNYTRDAAGAAKRIKAAFPDLAISTLEQQYDKLLGSVAADVTQATGYVQTTLGWTVESFKKAMELRARLMVGQVPPPPKPSDAEWAEAERLLTTAYKQYNLWATWRLEETGAALVYWDLLKHRLPRWRAAAEARQDWQRALRQRTEPPIVDPDLLRETHLRPRRVNPARDIWKARVDELNRPATGIYAGFRSGPMNTSGLESRLNSALGPFATNGLQQLLNAAIGKSVAGTRLEQLGVTREELNFLARMHGLLSQTAPQSVAPSEWDEIAAILTQVWKRRQAALWRVEESTLITLSPDWFKIPTVSSVIQFPPPKPTAPPKWRGTINDLSDWEDRLRSRIDQEQAVIDSFYQTVSEVEELTLPSLRDALIMASDAPDPSLSIKADWLIVHLLIDMKQSGCQKTTRIAQAIETLQQLLWGVRTGLVADAYPDLTLIPVKLKEETAIHEFDEAWKWIGSYATWRAAIFVFLYPENILLPTLKRYQTPAFRALSDDIGNTRRLTPTKALQKAGIYIDYFRDVCQLQLAACIRTRTRSYGEGEDKQTFEAGHDVEFLFGLTPSSRRLYWSLFDYDLPSDGYAQTFWRRLNQFKDEIVSVIGSVSYKTLSQRRFVYLFVKTQKDFTEKLEYLRISLDDGRIDESVEINIDKATRLDAVLKQTAEHEVPTLVVTVRNEGVESVFIIPLDEKGEFDESRKRTFGEARSWSAVSRVQGSLVYIFSGGASGSSVTPDWFGAHPVGAGLAVFEENNNRHLIFLHFGKGLFPGHTACLRIGQNLSTGGIIESWTNVVMLEDSDRVSHSNLNHTGSAILAGGCCIADLLGQGKKDLLILWAENETGNCFYWTGFGLKPDATFQYKNYHGYIGLSLGAAVIALDADITTINGELFLYVFYILRTPNGDQGFLRRHKLLNGGYRDGSSNWSPVFSCPPRNRTTSGGGITLGDLNGDGVPEIIVHYSETAPGGVYGRYYIGSSLQNDGNFGAWSEEFSLIASGEKLGEVVTGSTVTLLDVDKTGIPDLIFFYIKGERGRNDAYKSGYWGIGYESGITKLSTVSSCTFTGFKPFFLGPFNLYENISLSEYQQISTEAIQNNLPLRAGQRVYIEEAFYFVPVLLALQLQRSSEFLVALDWMRKAYDYTAPFQRRSLIGLAPNSVERGFRRDDQTISGDEYDWLLDPLNPHAIAKTRRETYLRATKIMVVKCLLDYADAEFTTDSSESIPRARELYMTALSLLYEKDLKPVSETCEGVIGDLEIMFGERWADYITELNLPGLHGGVHRMTQIRDGVKEILAKFNHSGLLLSKLQKMMAKYRQLPQPQVRFGKGLELLEDEAGLLEVAAISGKLKVALRGEGNRAAMPFNWRSRTGPGGGPVPPFPIGGPTPDDPLGPDGLMPLDIRDFWKRDPLDSVPLEMDRQNFPGFTKPLDPPDYSGWIKVSGIFCIPQNPILRMLRLRANLNLYKIRTCRNISGLKRELEVYAAPTDTQTGLPAIGAGGQLLLPGATRIQPTPYRYQALIERAKQLVQLATQMEQAFLSALEKSDAEAYAMIKAKQDLNLAKAGVRLQELRVTEAKGGVKLAGLQLQRTTILVDTYERWMSAGLNQREWDMITGYYVAGIAQTAAIAARTAADAIIAGKQTFGYASGFTIVAGAAQVAQAVAETTININRIWADYERRMQEWSLQRDLAEQDYAIADLQISLAEDHVRVTEQEHTIAQLQNDNAKEVVDFLAGKFTGKELYDWMSNILEGVYSFFLQQATAVAQLAQNQLAFERQETPPSFIQADYWDVPSDSGAGTLATTHPDRRGLTGSARLLQDIYQLDQYAFDTNKRKLQLTKIISLAQLAPFEFQRFRETGVLGFQTPMELFDRDFPGHYLRLIKRVRTSVIALIAPNQGIRATLSSTGLSRVVVGGDIFQKINLRRDPETIALSSPVNATGLFELEIQQHTEMLVPFEGTGVETQWEFRMLKASNQFNYDTIADVLLTIEYTALNSFDYREVLIQSPVLTRPLSADRPYSFRQEFADAWYDLHNPDRTPRPMLVTYNTRRADFAPNLENVKIQHVMFYVASSSEVRLELEDVELRFVDLSGGSVGGTVSTNEGVISTRRGNAGPWNAMIGKAPFGQWTLRLPDNPGVRELFDDTRRNYIADLLLVITYSGRTPEWPS